MSAKANKAEPAENEVTEMWREYHDDRQKKRERNRDSSTSFLKEQGVPFDSKNSGAHVMIRIAGLNIDFWPGTGLWRTTTPTKQEGRGVFKLFAYMEEHAWRTRCAADEPMPGIRCAAGRIVLDPLRIAIQRPPAPKLPAPTATDETKPPWEN